MKRTTGLFLSLSMIASVALAAPAFSADAKYVAFSFSQPNQIVVKDLSGSGVLGVYVNLKSFDSDSDPVTMTCGNGSQGAIRVFPGETRYCSAEFNTVSVALLQKDFKNGSTGIVSKYSF